MYCTDSMTYWCKKTVKDPHIKYSAAVVKMALDRWRCQHCGFTGLGLYGRMFCVPCCRPGVFE